MRTGKGWRLAEAARNMTARRHRRFSYGDWLCFCFIAGVTAGTAAALSFGNAASAEIRAFEYAVPSASLWAAGLKARLADAVVVGGIKKTLANGVFLTVLIKRLFQAGAGWLAGLMICSRFFFGCLTVWAGMCVSVSFAALTLEKGAVALPSYLWYSFPQGIIYFFVWTVLAGWAGGRERRLRAGAFLLLMAVTAMGAALECVFHG